MIPKDLQPKTKENQQKTTINPKLSISPETSPSFFSKPYLYLLQTILPKISSRPSLN